MIAEFELNSFTHTSPLQTQEKKSGREVIAPNIGLNLLPFRDSSFCLLPFFTSPAPSSPCLTSCTSPKSFIIGRCPKSYEKNTSLHLSLFDHHLPGIGIDEFQPRLRGLVIRPAQFDYQIGRASCRERV